MSTAEESAEKYRSALIDAAVEGWRFSRLFSRLISKLDAGEGSRYLSQQRYFQKKISESLEDVGLKLVNVEGQVYDPGIAATALNLEDFAPHDVLMVEQMVEPIIMDANGLCRSGTVMLMRVGK
jgi:hypothetical protein